jgi:hypothetical protein
LNGACIDQHFIFSTFTPNLDTSLYDRKKKFVQGTPQSYWTAFFFGVVCFLIRNCFSWRQTGVQRSIFVTLIQLFNTPRGWKIFGVIKPFFFLHLFFANRKFDFAEVRNNILNHKNVGKFLNPELFRKLTKLENFVKGT